MREDQTSFEFAPSAELLAERLRQVAVRRLSSNGGGVPEGLTHMLPLDAMHYNNDPRTAFILSQGWQGFFLNRLRGALWRLLFPVLARQAAFNLAATQAVAALQDMAVRQSAGVADATELPRFDVDLPPRYALRAEAAARYAETLRDCGNVLDLRCGDGELLSALGAAGVEARGVDVNRGAVAAARARGLSAEVDSAIATLVRVPAGSLGGIVAVGLLERLHSREVVEVMSHSARALRRGGMLTVETLNATCLLASAEAARELDVIRLYRVELLEWALESHGFADVNAAYLDPVDEAFQFPTLPAPTNAGFAAFSQRIGTINDVLLGHRRVRITATR